MRWKHNKYYAELNKNYRIVKSGRIPLHPKYLTYVVYSQKKKLLDEGPFYTAKEAADACERHYLENNKQTEGDMF